MRSAAVSLVPSSNAKKTRGTMAGTGTREAEALIAFAHGTPYRHQKANAEQNMQAGVCDKDTRACLKCKSNERSAEGRITTKKCSSEARRVFKRSGPSNMLSHSPKALDMPLVLLGMRMTPPVPRNISVRCYSLEDSRHFSRFPFSATRSTIFANGAKPST